MASTGEWSIVTRRRRRGSAGDNHRNKRLIPHPHPGTLTLTPTPWSPSDPSTDPDRESRLLKRMRSAVHRLDRSRFYRRFLSRLRDSHFQAALAALGPATAAGIQIVVYGIGSIESYDPPRLQLALAVLLRRDLGRDVVSVEVFDPVLSAAECAILESLGCTVIQRDEQGRRAASVPTIFYMPHCEAALYDNLLEANWRPAALKQMAILGNSFGEYGRYVDEMTGGRGSVAVRAAAQHVLEVRKYVREVGIEGDETTESVAEDANGEVGMDLEKRTGSVVEEDDDGFFRAFHDMSWHFFELEDDQDMNFARS